MSSISILKKSIIKLSAEVVVNAANTHLQEGSGVCGYIFKAAGSRQLQDACNQYGSCKTGYAVITPGFNLCKYIVHAVGPVWTGGKNNEPKQLYSCYQMSMDLARVNDCHSIGFPLISAGIFGYPVDKAWKKALQAINDWLNKNQDYEIDVQFAVLDNSILDLGLETAKQLGITVNESKKPKPVQKKKEQPAVGFDFNSVYDTQFDTLSFAEINKRKQSEADKIIQRVADILNEKGFFDQLKKPDSQYVVDMTEDIKAAIDAGAVKLDAGKNGKIYAQLRINGKFGEKLPIKKVLKEADLDPVEVGNALQMKAIEMQMAKMITMLDKIGTELDDVKQGQQNDRIALFYSGMNLYLEARAVKDPDLRKYLVSQAMKGISDSHAQIMQQLQMDINYLMTGQYTKVKGKSYEDMQEHMISINKSYDVIYRAMMLKAAIYYEQEELEALMTCLSEYGRFIEMVIIPIASELTELDASITTLKNGVWDQRAKSLATVNELKNQLEHNNTYLLEMSLSDDQNSDQRNSGVTVREVNYGG